MRAITRLFLMIAAMGGAFSVNAQEQQKPIPPYETPVYAKPADDSVAFGSLLEAAGYSEAMRYHGWVGVAAGNFCGATEKQLIVVTDQFWSDLVLHLLQGPTPHVVAKIDPKPVVEEIDPRLGRIGAFWRAVAAGRLDSNKPHDQIVAVLKSGLDLDVLIVMEVSSVAG